MNFDPFMWFVLSELDEEERRQNEQDSYDNHWSYNGDEENSDDEEQDNDY